ncbi:MAG TPA: LysR substrate-binding domain-containing protein [Steroidobacteraceae bacterium]|jgi:LysR family nitrogen assimilation transcriptional regulator
MVDPKTLDIKHLRYFVGVVDAGSLTRAAAALHVAQPALSSRIARMEDAFGVKLLVRSAQGVHPTEEGRILYVTAARLLRDLENVAATVRSLGRSPAGRVTVGCIQSAANMIAVPLITAVLEQLPQVELSVVSGQSVEIYRRLMSGELDLAVIIRTSNVHGISSRKLLTEDLLLAVSARNDPLPGLDTVTAAELTKLSFVLPRPTVFSVHEMIQRALKEREVDFTVLAETITVLAETNSVDALRTLVAEGRGASVLPWSVISPSVLAGDVKLKKIVGMDFRLPHELCRPVGLRSSSAIDAVESLIVTIVRRLIADGTWRYATLHEESTIRSKDGVSQVCSPRF